MDELGIGRISLGAIERVQFTQEFLGRIREEGEKDLEYLDLRKTA